MEGDQPVAITGKEIFSWLKGSSEQQITNTNKAFDVAKDKGFVTDNGPRSFIRDTSPWDLKSEFLHVLEDKGAEKLRVGIRECSSAAEIMANDGECDPVKWMGVLKEAAGHYYHFHPGFSRDGDYMDGYGRFFMNEGFVPILLKMEKVFEGENIDIKKTVIENLASLAEDEYSVGCEVNSQTEQIVRTIINIGGADSMGVVSGLVSRLDAKETEFYADSLEDNPFVWEPRYDEIELVYNENDFRFVHYAICDAIRNREWTKEGKPIIARSLGGLLGINSTGSLGRYEDAFNFLGVENSVPVLLENLKSEDTLTRRMSAEILCRMEMGRIGISPEGVKYFDKIYKLMKASDPEFLVKLYSEKESYVERIDNSGKIGVFAGDGKLLGSFDLQLESRNDQVEAEVSDVTDRDIFLPKADETPEQRKAREFMTTLFLSHYGNLKDDLFRETGVRLNSVALHEQGWFALSYQQANNELKGRLNGVIKEYGELGLKAFLAADYSGSAESVLSYLESETSTKEQKEQILRHFNRMTDGAYGWRNIFEKVDMGFEHKVAPEIHEVLIRKSCEYLLAAAMVDKGKGGGLTHEVLLRSMESVSWALEEIKGLGDFSSPLVLVEKPDVRTEYIDSEKKTESPGISMSWKLKNPNTGTIIHVTQRAKKTYGEVGKEEGGGQARIGLNVVNVERNLRTRISLDADDRLGEPRVTFDLGTGLSKESSPDDDKKRPTVRVSEVLKNVPGSEGGHTTSSFGEESTEQFGEYSWALRRFMIERFRKKKTYEG